MIHGGIIMIKLKSFSELYANDYNISRIFAMKQMWEDLQKKIDRAKLLLLNEMLDVQQIAFELNYDDCGYFCRIFKKMCGCTPGEYRKKYLH